MAAMKNINNFNDFLFEKYGSNKFVKDITNHIKNKINNNISTLISNKGIILKNNLSDFNDICFIDDLFNISITDRNYGYIIPDKIKIKDNTISNMTVKIDFILSDQERLQKKINHDNGLYNTISHEILHVIEKYLTIKSGNTISKSWSYGKKLQILKNKYPNENNLKKILNILYLTLPHEIRSRIQYLNTEIENANIVGMNIVREHIKKSNIYKDMVYISKIDPILLLNGLKKDKEYDHIIIDFNKIYLDNNVSNIENCEKEFLMYCKKIFKYCKNNINKILKISNHFESVINDDNYIHEDFFDIIIDYDEFIK